MLGGDPAAGSPTATLLRLHPPQKTEIRIQPKDHNLIPALFGWCDGRCVQGAGTYSPHGCDMRLLRIPAS